jgi:hypothetical protein
MSKIQHIDPSSLSQLPSRIHYLHSFLAFNPTTDGPLIKCLLPVLAPLLPAILDAVYTQLLSYDITARSFLPAQASTNNAHRDPGIEERDVAALNLDHANIKHRKDFLRAYLVRLLTNDDWSPESDLWRYLDNVGRVHTGRQRTSSRNVLKVEYVHTALLLGWVQDAIVGMVMGVQEDSGDGGWTTEKKVEVLRALGKFWWVQNDLFARHYFEGGEGSREEEGRRMGWRERPVVQMVGLGAAGLVTGGILVAFLLS